MEAIQEAGSGRYPDLGVPLDLVDRNGLQEEFFYRISLIRIFYALIITVQTYPNGGLGPPNGPRPPPKPPGG